MDIVGTHETYNIASEVFDSSSWRIQRNEICEDPTNFPEPKLGCNTVHNLIFILNQFNTALRTDLTDSKQSCMKNDHDNLASMMKTLFQLESRVKQARIAPI